MIVSYICLGVVTIMTFVQKMVLLVCWSCCPVLFAFLAIPLLAHLGSAHVMRCFAIICWPFGLAVASTFSDGALNAALKDRLLAGDSIANNLGAAIENLLIIGVIGLWSIVSSFLAPAFIQQFLVGYSGPARTISMLGLLGVGVLFPKMAIAVAGMVSSIRSRLSPWGNSSDSSKHHSPPPPPVTPPPSTSVRDNSPGNSAVVADPDDSIRLQKLLNRD